MAREIDLTSDSFSDEELEYIAQRPWLADEAALLGNDKLAKHLEDRAMRLESGEQEFVDVSTEGNPPPPQELEDDYDDEEVWDYRGLQAEAKERGLTASGSREEVVARLRENDAANS